MDVTDAIHKAGMKFLLWFEPERVIRTAPIALSHPEYFFNAINEKDDSRILNLGNPDAWEYCYNTLSEKIETLRIDCYRQDFNISPLETWRKNDGADRQGISEIKHTMGFYRLWDALLEKFPHLIIDNCASGGRRIDIETLRRSMPMWRSDVQCPANFPEYMSQIHNLTYNMWMPYSGTGTGRLYNTYRFRSCYGASMTTNYTFSEKDSFGDDPEKIQWLKKCDEEYLKLRPYFSEDFYPLTEPCDKTDVWCAAQFDRSSEHDGIVQVFRRENSPYETAVFKLGGINKTAVYTITDMDSGEEITVSAAELAEKGFYVKISNPATAKVYIYKY